MLEKPIGEARGVDDEEIISTLERNVVRLQELVYQLLLKNEQLRYLIGNVPKTRGNADTIQGIKIDTDAMARTAQLVQEGFVKISES